MCNVNEEILPAGESSLQFDIRRKERIMNNSDTVMNSSMFINWQVATGAMVLLTIFAFVSWAKAQKVLKNRRVNDAKFFIESGFKQIFELARASDRCNTEWGYSIGAWEIQLQNFLPSLSSGNLFSETISLEEEIRDVISNASNPAVERALVGFRQIRKELKVLCQEKNEVDYNQLLNDTRGDFLEWRDKMKEIEREFQGPKGKVIPIKQPSKRTKKKKGVG
jgi:hypothetical protein